MRLSVGSRFCDRNHRNGGGGEAGGEFLQDGTQYLIPRKPSTAPPCSDIPSTVPNPGIVRVGGGVPRARRCDNVKKTLAMLYSGIKNDEQVLLGARPDARQVAVAAVPIEFGQFKY